MASGKAGTHFWLDGGYDFDLVQACRFHPDHHWITVDVEMYPGQDECIVVCSSCGVPCCGHTVDPDPCTLWRHHETEHVYESGKTEPVGGW